MAETELIEEQKVGYSTEFDLQAHINLLRFLRRKEYVFTTVTPSTHSQLNSRPENLLAKDLRGIFGWNRPFNENLATPELFALMLDANVIEPFRHADTHSRLWRSRIRVSSLSDQLFMHSGFPTTQNDAVFFGPDTYRFISVINRYIAGVNKPIRRIVDIGCGSGAGAIIAAVVMPAAEVYAVDINKSALQMTCVNSRFAGVMNVQPRFSNLLNDVTGKFDLIVANPPYLMDTNERTYRHGGGHLGAGLSLDILQASLSRLAEGGTLLLYTGVAIVEGVDPFLLASRELLKNFAVEWSYEELDPDIFSEELLCDAYSNVERIAAVLLTVAR